MSRHEELTIGELTVRKVKGELSGELGIKCVTGVINFNVATPFTVDLGTVPKNATIVGTLVKVETAFNALTTNVLVVGNATTDDAYVAAGDVAEGAVGTTVVGANRPVLTANTVIKAKYTQTGTAATTGKAHCTLFYIP